MAIYAKPVKEMVIIKPEDTKKFIEHFNNNKVDEAFLASCKKAGSLFEKNK